MSHQIPDIRFWAGTEESFNAYLVALQAVTALDVKAYYDDDEDEDAPPRLLSKQGNVGVVTITGPLVPGAPWYAKYRGMTGYDEIREALIAAAQDPDIGAILLDVNSGGGAVSGVTDVADLVRSIDRQIKPVQALTTGVMASAALWVGASGRKVSVGKVAEVGSIGVLTVMQSMKEFYKKMGIDAEVLRSAEFKALGHPLDPITDKARAEIMGQLEQMDSMFNAYMAEARGLSADTARERFGKGRIFIGQAAVGVGLADAVASYDAVISEMQGAIDAQKSRSQYGANFQKGPAVKNALTEQQIAALAEGAGAQGAATEPTGAATPDQASSQDEAGGGGAAAVEEPKKDAQAPNEVVAFLQGQLAQVQAQVLDLTVQLRDKGAEADKLKGAVASMRAIAETSVTRLRVALGMPEADISAMSEQTLLETHSSLRADFEKKFKAGGVAAVAPVDPAENKNDAVVDPLRARRVKATRPQ